MNLESRARRAAASLKASVAGLAVSAGGAAPAPSRRRLVGGLAIGGALAAALLVVAVLVLPSSGDPQTVAGSDLSPTTTAGATVIDGSTTVPGTGAEAPDGSAGYPDHQGPLGPDQTPTTGAPDDGGTNGQNGGNGGQSSAEGDHSDVRPAFWASQAYGCSADEQPAELFFGGGEPGGTITLDSPYGSATAAVGEDGYWEAALAFSSAPYDEPFTVTVTGTDGEAWDLSFVVADPATGECEPYVDYAFSAYALWGCSIEEPPSDLFYGTGDPGDLISLESPYGGGTATVDEWGWWEATITFDGTPQGEAFVVTATNGAGEAWEVYFAAADPDDGSCMPPMEYWFSAYQGSGCSIDAPPTDYFYGTGMPGDVIEITSPYGSASAVVDEWGWWETAITFEGAPYDEPFEVQVASPAGEVWAFTFTAPDPETGSCWFFTAYQAAGCSSEEPPGDYFWGTGDPGDPVTLNSPYGSAETVIDESGYWEAYLTFPGAPVGETFTIEVVAPDGTVWAFPFIVADPEAGSCWGEVDPCTPDGDCDGGAWSPDPVYVGSVDLISKESYPVQVSAVIEGYLPTPCHTLAWDLSGSEDGLYLDLYSAADPTGACAQVLEPFTEVVDLGSFKTGSYVLYVNGVAYPFEI